jgi:hypothetical protein
MSSNQLPKWTQNDGQEVEAVRITRMTETEKDHFRIEHDEPHAEPIQVGREFVDKAGGMQQEGFYVRGGDQGERWMSAAHFQGTRQHMDSDETPEKGFVAKASQAPGPILNQVNSQPTPADLAAEEAKRVAQQGGHVQTHAVPGIDANAHTATAARHAEAVPHTANLPTTRATEEAPARRAHR